MPAVEELTGERLRGLAGLRAEKPVLISLYLDLEPSEFASAPARASQLDSLLDGLRREIEEGGRGHDELIGLRADADRIEALLRGESDLAAGARALAVFACGELDLLRALRLSHPVPASVSIGEQPELGPLLAGGEARHTCVALVDERHARILVGGEDTLRELTAVGDDVHGRHDQGGWSQARYQRSVEQDVDRHLRHVAEVLRRRLEVRPFRALIIAATPPVLSRLESLLHPDLRRILDEPIPAELTQAGIEEVNRRVTPVIGAARERRREEALGRLRDSLGAGGHAVAGLEGSLQALVERRVEVLLYREGFGEPGSECPSCGWLSAEPSGPCPVDGTEMEPRESIIESAVARALAQDAEVFALPLDSPDLGPLGGIACLLRF